MFKTTSWHMTNYISSQLIEWAPLPSAVEGDLLHYIVIIQWMEAPEAKNRGAYIKTSRAIKPMSTPGHVQNKYSNNR